LSALTGLIDVVVQGVNLTARVGEGPALDFLVDSSLGLAAVSSGARPRATVPLHTDGEVWELGLEASGSDVLLSLFRHGPEISVAIFERPIPAVELRDALCRAIDENLDGREVPAPAVALGLKAARRQLASLSPVALPILQRVETHLSAARGRLRAELSARLRTSTKLPSAGPRLERADVHATLARGEIELCYGQNRLALVDSHVFLDIERLLFLVEEAAQSRSTGRPTFRRAQLSTARASLRRGPGDAPAELRIEPLGKKPFVLLIETELLTCVVARLAAKLTECLCEHDREQHDNLRVSRVAALASELLTQLEPSDEDEIVTNPQPESYRRFMPRVKRAKGVWDHGAKMRFLPRWVAAVPRIDLRGTFLCGDRLIVGGIDQTACLDRRSGEVLWQHAWPAAARVVTPSGLVRIEPDGRLSCHHLDDGELRFSLRLKPKPQGGATGAVLYGPSLPKLLAVTEDDRQVTGIDLVSGDVRWRYTAKRPAPYRVRRAGRLLLVSGGDSLLVAIDGVNGEVVWSLKSPLPFSGDVTLSHDTACTLSGAPGGAWLLHRLNPFSGVQDWFVELEDRPLGRAPLLTPSTIVVPTCDGPQVGAVAFDRETGKKLWEQAPGLVEGASAWLALDDAVLVNCQSGILLALDAATGAVRFSHVFSSGAAADQPRRLEPVLRSGALFVPQQSVQVVRPQTGEILGALPSDLVPDLIRVDERCDVYVAEESGHMAAFSAAPRLSVVR
jgi:outer membrane protein assembly factor BamB